MKYFTLIIFLLISLPISASIYVQTDAKGNPVYSDVPQSDAAQKVENVDNAETPAINLTPALTTPANQASAKLVLEEASHQTYSSFTILSPKNQESIQNQPILRVDVGMSPALQKGDMVQILLDGQALGPAKEGTHFEFTIPERGAHQLSANLIDSKQQLLMKTGPITIYVHQAHIGGPALPAS